jgi:hypothetical protein
MDYRVVCINAAKAKSLLAVTVREGKSGRLAVVDVCGCRRLTWKLKLQTPSRPAVAASSSPAWSYANWKLGPIKS